jgi:hypothetical protein
MADTGTRRTILPTQQERTEQSPACRDDDFEILRISRLYSEGLQGFSKKRGVVVITNNHPA